MSNDDGKDESNVNPFDQLSVDKDDQLKNMSPEHKKLDTLIHIVFYQTDPGVELLNMWKRTTLMRSSTSSGNDLLNIGLEEGRKDFVRNIISTIEGVNNG